MSLLGEVQKEKRFLKIGVILLFIIFLTGFCGAVSFQEYENVRISFGEITEQIKNTQFLYIIWLAVIDSINPLEFIVIILLVTMLLSENPKDKKRAIYSGFGFSLGILTAYAFFGLLMITGFTLFKGLAGFEMRPIFFLLGIMAVSFGVLDIASNFFGKEKNIPGAYEIRLKKISKRANNTRGAFFLGLASCFFLTSTTAGPYVVAGGILSTMSFFEAVPLFLLYLGIFLLPMILITVFACRGFLKINNVSEWREKNMEKINLLTGLLMIGIGITLILMGQGII